MSHAAILLAMIPLSYVIGSIPFGLIVGLSRGVDPRTAGSGNIGATNVGRLLGGRYFAFVFLLDLIKGMTPVLIAGAVLHFHVVSVMQSSLWIMIGLATLLGNLFSIFLRFRGGKGVATSAGVLIGVFPYCTMPAMIAIVVFIITFVAWRYISLASMVAAVAFPLAYIGLGAARHWPVFSQQLPMLFFAIIVPVLILWKHRANIARLRSGTESKFGRPRPPA